MGHISGVYGVRGWVRVHSYTRPRENIIEYQPWFLKQAGIWQERKLTEGKRQGKGVLASLEGCLDRDTASNLVGREIGICRDQLPPAAPGEFYWSDLQGLEVINLQDEVFGVVDHLIETGANDVLVIQGERERLIPFIQGPVVVEVDLNGRRIRVDWDSDF